WWWAGRLVGAASRRVLSLREGSPGASVLATALTLACKAFRVGGDVSVCCGGRAMRPLAPRHPPLATHAIHRPTTLPLGDGSAHGSASRRVHPREQRPGCTHANKAPAAPTRTTPRLHPREQR